MVKLCPHWRDGGATAAILRNRHIAKGHPTLNRRALMSAILLALVAVAVMAPDWWRYYAQVS